MVAVVRRRAQPSRLEELLWGASPVRRPEAAIQPLRRYTPRCGRRLSQRTRWGPFYLLLWAKHLGLGPASLRHCSSPFLAGSKNTLASFFRSASTIPMTADSFSRAMGRAIGNSIDA
jgi:hypothetical protein